MATQPYHVVRNSKIHGRGVFAKRPIRKGTRIIEYTGPIISTKAADKLATEDATGHSHTMLFTIDDKRVIDGTRGGDAKYINHSCDPNCETIQDGDHIYIEAIRAIKQGEELAYDYHLQVEGKITDEVKKQYVCYCGSKKCRGTQIAKDLLEKQAKKDKKKAEKKKAKAEKKRLKEEKKKAKAEAKAKAKAEEKLKQKKAKAAEKAKTKGKTDDQLGDKKKKSKKGKKDKSKSK